MLCQNNKVVTKIPNRKCNKTKFHVQITLSLLFHLNVYAKNTKTEPTCFVNIIENIWNTRLSSIPYILDHICKQASHSYWRCFTTKVYKKQKKYWN